MAALAKSFFYFVSKQTRCKLHVEPSRNSHGHHAILFTEYDPVPEILPAPA